MDKSNKDKQPKQTREEKLRLENEIEKLKLSAFYDAQFFSSNKDLPFEVEDEWLRYIAHFEKEWEDIECITIAEKLGHPEFPPVEGLSEPEIVQKLEEIQQLMAEENIFLDAIAEVPAAELYRFITEELFNEQIDDFDVEGLQTCFIYEEFYPNNKLDIEETVTDFIHEMMNKEAHPYMDIHLAERCIRVSGTPITTDVLFDRIFAYINQYDRILVDTVDAFEILINEKEECASARFNVSYRCIAGQQVHVCKGGGRAILEKGELGYWNIVTLDTPGFAF